MICEFVRGRKCEVQQNLCDETKVNSNISLFWGYVPLLHVKFEGTKGSVKSGTMEALSTTLSTRPALYIGLGLLAAALAIKVVAPVLYNRLVFYLRMAVVFVYRYTTSDGISSSVPCLV